MACYNKFGSLLRQSVSVMYGQSSMLNAIRDMSTELFVGGLSYGTDDQSLRDAFASYGNVTDARVITDRDSGRWRGFGFVSFANDESASSALSAMDGQQLNGRNIHVSYAQERAPCSSFNNGGGGGFREIKFGGRIIYSSAVEEVERAAKELLDFVEAKKINDEQCILGLDIEWRPTFRTGVAPGKAAVMQICGENGCCHVLHIIHSGIPKSLQSLLEDQTILKVGVNIATDASKVLRDYNVSINTLGDLSHLANQKLGGDPKKWSLSSLVEMLICKKDLRANCLAAK